MKKKMLLTVLMIIFVSFLVLSEEPRKTETDKNETPYQWFMAWSPFPRINFPQSYNDVINSRDIIVNYGMRSTYTKNGWQEIDSINDQKEFLKGIKCIIVSVSLSGKEEVVKKVKDCGLTEDLIKTDVELKLRLAGIKVLPAVRPKFPVVLDDSNIKEYDKSMEGYHLAKDLCVSVNLMESGFTNDFIFIYNITMPHRAFLGYRRSFVAITWNVEYFGRVGSSHLEECIRNGIKKGIDKFMNDYLEVNPKE